MEMHWAVFGLVLLTAFMSGGVAWMIVLWRYTWIRSTAGRPMLVTLPGTRPGTSVTYAIRPDGVWKRLTSRRQKSPRWQRILHDDEGEEQ